MVNETKKHQLEFLLRGMSIVPKTFFAVCAALFILLLPLLFASLAPAFGQSAEVTPAQEREELEKELTGLEAQISAIEKDITKTQKEKDTLKNKISILRGKIQKLDLQIQQSNKIIGDLRSQIGDTSSSIEKTTEDVGEIKRHMGKILQTLYEEDRKSGVEIVLSSSNLSEFFNNSAALEALNGRLGDLLADLEELNAYLQSQRDALEEEKTEEENFLKIQALQKQESQSVKSQTEKLLVETSGKESEYQQLLLDKQKRATEIRSRIFELIGVPEAPTFGEALEIAKVVANQTGIRPALLLAVLTQESNLGKNVGQCFLKDTLTGSGVRVLSGASVSKVMKPSRDVQPFLQITKELGRDPFNTPVSCPIKSVGGYGGAMGPAQFIPSTWMAYRDKLQALIGRPADPWNIKDAFLAAGLYLANYGAAKQEYNSEWKAAMIYFSGGTNTRYRFYGDSVMAIAQQYEKDIEALNGSLSVAK